LFIAAFSGLYFTVSAVGDSTYREMFFAELSQSLERAIGVRAVYWHLIREGEAPLPQAPGESDVASDP
jgi:hypothetical protein